MSPIIGILSVNFSAGTSSPVSSRMRSQPQLRNDKYITVSLHLAYCCTATAHCSTYSYLRNFVSRSRKRWFLICETLRYLKLCPFRHQVQCHQITPIFTPPNTFYALKNPHHYISAGVFIVKTNSSYILLTAGYLIGAKFNGKLLLLQILIDIVHASKVYFSE